VRKYLPFVLALSSCSGMKTVTVARPSWDGLMAGHTIYNRLVSAQAEIRKAPNGSDKKAAQRAFVLTEAVWEAYSTNPTVENWNEVQTVGSNLDTALRKLRGEQVGAPGKMPPCVTMKESWCRKPHLMVPEPRS
jgi:hypothetical protein